MFPPHKELPPRPGGGRSQAVIDLVIKSITYGATSALLGIMGLASLDNAWKISRHFEDPYGHPSFLIHAGYALYALMAGVFLLLALAGLVATLLWIWFGARDIRPGKY